MNTDTDMRIFVIKILQLWKTRNSGAAGILGQREFWGSGNSGAAGIMRKRELYSSEREEIIG